MSVLSFVMCTAPFLFFAVSASAAPLLEAPQAFNPSSRTASAITGPVIASRSNIVFGNGVGARLRFIDYARSDWGSSSQTLQAQIFAFEADPGELLNGNTLCGADEAPKHLVAFQSESFGSWFLTLAVFRSENTPSSIDDLSLCGTFNFALDGPIEQVDNEDVAIRNNGGEYLEPIGPVILPDIFEPDTMSSKWSLRRSTNAIDDSPIVTLSLVADEGRSRMGDPVLFIARCRSNSTEAYVNWNTYVGDDSRSPYSEVKSVTVRIGDAASEDEVWSVSTDRQATFAPEWAGNFLKRMVSSDRLILRMTPYNENPITAIFDIRGMSEPLRELSSTCNWSF